MEDYYALGYSKSLDNFTSMQPNFNQKYISGTDDTPPPTPPQNFHKSQKREGWKSAFSTVLILIAAPIIALLLTAFVFQSYEVDGPSMETTLQDRDRLIVWKLPRTVARVTNKPFIPERGEIVIFIMHGIEAFDPTQDKQLIKRVIGLPGDRVVIRDGLTTVYNDEHPDGYNPDLTGDYKVIEDESQSHIDLYVPQGEIFVAGDNRPNSLDSRTFGTISVNDIVGTLSYRIFPLNKAESF